MTTHTCRMPYLPCGRTMPYLPCGRTMPYLPCGRPMPYLPCRRQCPWRAHIFDSGNGLITPNAKFDDDDAGSGGGLVITWRSRTLGNPLRPSHRPSPRSMSNYPFAMVGAGRSHVTKPLLLRRRFAWLAAMAAEACLCHGTLRAGRQQRRRGWVISMGGQQPRQLSDK